MIDFIKIIVISKYINNNGNKIAISLNYIRYLYFYAASTAVEAISYEIGGVDLSQNKNCPNKQNSKHEIRIHSATYGSSSRMFKQE